MNKLGSDLTDARQGLIVPVAMLDKQMMRSIDDNVSSVLTRPCNLPRRYLGNKWNTAVVDKARTALTACVVIACLLYGQHSHAATLNAPAGDVHQPEELIKNILRYEFKLARFNLHYKLEAARQGRWKPTRYFLFQEANAAVGFAGAVTGMGERMAHIQNRQYRHLNVRTLLKGNVESGVGQIIGGSGSAIEFGVNTFHMWRASRKGFSQGQAKKYVGEITQRIDQELIDLEAAIQREQVAGNHNCSKLHTAERSVLADMRNLLLCEFNGFHIGATRTLVYQQSFYALDILRNATGAVGNLYGYKALRERNRLFNRPAGTLVTISGAMIMLDPIASRLLGRAAAAWDRHSLRQVELGAPTTNLAKLTSDCRDLQSACASVKASGESTEARSVTRMELYESHRQRFDRQLQTSSKEAAKGNRVAVQNVLSGLFIGGTKVANGIEFMEAGFRYHKDPRMTNVMLGTGAIPSVVGLSYAMLDNARIQANREITNYKLNKKHQLPGQLIKAQLEDLERLEKSLDSI